MHSRCAQAATPANTVEINPQPTPFTDEAHFALAGAAGLIMPALLNSIRT